MSIAPPKKTLRTGPPRGSGKLAHFVMSMRVGVDYVIQADHYQNVYDAARTLGISITSCRRNLPDAPRLRPNTMRVWRLG